MNFATIAFFVFLAAVYLMWRSLSVKNGNRLLLIASLFFYGYWYPPFLFLLIASGIIDYSIGLVFAKYGPQKKWLILSVVANLGILFFFKYYNFFGSVLQDAAALAGTSFSYPFLEILLPMGISFYTFQSMSYTIDIYRGRLKACSSPVDFFLYLTFFPQLVAGPIVRAIDFIPQISNQRRTSQAQFDLAIFRILRGLFLKVVIADNIAKGVDYFFNSPAADLSTSQAWIGAVGFSIQIFCDFSGYSDIAIGTALLFGFQLRENFRNPYLALGMQDFWQRWHISLTSWFRDYLYIPLGGNRGGSFTTYRNIFLVFLLSGLWHGARWTFVCWGLIHFVGLIIERQWFTQVRLVNSRFRLVGYCFMSYTATMLFVLFAWVAFRSQSLTQALDYWQVMVTGVGGGEVTGVTRTLLLIGVFTVYQLVALAKEQNWLKESGNLQRWESLVFFTTLVLLAGESSDFIYFQF